MSAPDPYRSRTASTWEIAPRPDPVRWGDAEGPLSEADLATFVDQGFLIAPGILSQDEVARLLAEAHQVAQEVPEDAEHVIREPDSSAVRSVFRVHQTSPAFRALSEDPRLAGAARQLVGSEVYIHQSRVNFKPGFRGREFYWHSDFETWHLEDGMPLPRAISASILLTENTSVNGPLMLVPGSHKRYVRCVGETPEEHYKQSLRAQEYGVPAEAALRELVEGSGIVEATGPAGTVVFFDCNTMHGSTGNLSPYPRHNVFLVFNSVENRLGEPVGGQPPRPEFLAER